MNRSSTGGCRVEIPEILVDILFRRNTLRASSAISLLCFVVFAFSELLFIHKLAYCIYVWSSGAEVTYFILQLIVCLFVCEIDIRLLCKSVVPTGCDLKEYFGQKMNIC